MGLKKGTDAEKEKKRLEALQETERNFLKGTYGDFFGDGGGGKDGKSGTGNLTFGETAKEETSSATSPKEKAGASPKEKAGNSPAAGLESRFDALAKKGEEIVSAVSSKNDALRRANEALREVQSLLDNPLYDGMPSLTGSGNSESGINPGLMAGSDGDLFSGMAPGTAAPDTGVPGAAGQDASFPDAEKGAAASAAVPAASASVNAEEQKPAEPEKDPMEELDGLIGLTSIKHDVRELTDFVKIQKMRGEGGLKAVPVSLHLVFTGNPGTGKTTVARILAKIYRQIGVLSKGQLVEVDRSGLVAGYVGQTALKTAKKIEEAKGGILFIDEAYALARRDDTFGQEAIDTILKAMEDLRDDFVVIVAGYTGPMENFINSNPGLKSRFNKYIEFPDYTIDELMGIFEMNCRKYDYETEDEVKAQVRAIIVQRRLATMENFANAREVRNLFEEIITNQARRVAAMESPTQEDMKKILLEDLFETAENDAEKTLRKAEKAGEVSGAEPAAVETGEDSGTEPAAVETGEVSGKEPAAGDVEEDSGAEPAGEEA